jgi:hypothetical protein
VSEILPEGAEAPDLSTPSNVGQPTAAPGSLEARVAERRKKLESQTTAMFEVPGYEDLFQVELQMIGWKRLRSIAAGHERVRDDAQRELRTAADHLLAATVGFHAVVDDEGTTEPAEDASWRKIASAADPSIDGSVPTRALLTRFLGESPTIFLWTEWQEWMKTGASKLERDLEKDF